MRTARSPAVVRGLLAVACFATAPLYAQEDAPAQARSDPAHIHLRHVSQEFRGTPEGAGLLPTAISEAAVAAQHAQLAARDSTDLDAIKRHVGHVLHALDPTLVESGPGSGYGARKAADGAARHVALAAESAGATDNIRTHAEHVSTAAASAVARADEAIELAGRIEEAESAEAAAALLDELVSLTDAIANGRDADGDGRVGWQEGEGGLAQAATHMELMLAGEARASGSPSGSG